MAETVIEDKILLLDYYGNAFVFGGAKPKGKSFDKGQRIVYENISKSHVEAGNPCIVFIYEYDGQAKEKTILAKDCPVVSIYWKTKWFPVVGRTLLQHIEEFERYYQKHFSH